MKLELAKAAGYAACLNPLQEVGVMKHWLWEAPSLLAWQGHLRTVALKHTHGFGQHGHYG